MPHANELDLATLRAAMEASGTPSHKAALRRQIKKAEHASEAASGAQTSLFEESASPLQDDSLATLTERIEAIALALQEWTDHEWEGGKLSRSWAKLQDPAHLAHPDRPAAMLRYLAEEQKAYHAFPLWEEYVALLEEHDHRVLHGLGPPQCWACTVAAGMPYSHEAGQAFIKEHGKAARLCPRHAVATIARRAELRQNQEGSDAK